MNLINLTIEKAKADISSFNTIHTPIGDQNLRTNLNLNSLVDTSQTIIRVMLDTIGYLSALFFLYGAFLYIISYGNEAKAGKAKQTMTWAVLGLAIAILARLMVGVILSLFSSNEAIKNVETLVP